MRASAFVLALTLLVGGCSTTEPNDVTDAAIRTVDTSLFVATALTSAVTEEPCVLSGGTTSTCVRFSVSTVPVDHRAGPWCPGTIRDDASQGGIWPENGVANAVDGPFIENLATFYNDPFWRLYDDAGNVRITDTRVACAAAANPNVGAEYANYCVECQTSYLASDMQVTYVIPKRPVLGGRTQAARATRWASRFNGISFAPAGPDRPHPRRLHARAVRRLRRPRQPQRGLPLPRGDGLQHAGRADRRPRGR